MLLTKDDIINALRESQNLREAMDRYCPHPVVTPISMDVVTEGVRQLCDVEIEIRRMPFESEERLRGIYLPYEDKTVILLDADLNESWSRYVAMKEIGHIVLADAENVTENPGETIEFMVQDGLGAALEATPAPADAANEMLAKIVAYETLFPHSERERGKRLLDEDGAFNLYILSEDYGIPEHVVEFVLSDGYLDLCKRLRP